MESVIMEEVEGAGVRQGGELIVLRMGGPHCFQGYDLLSCSKD